MPKVKTTSGWSTVDIDASAESLAPEPTLLVAEALSPSPTRPSAPPLAAPFSLLQNENEWATPGLFKRRLTWGDDESSSSAFTIGTRGLFDEEDEFDLGHRKKRPRFSSSYRLLDGNESPPRDASGEDGVEEEEEIVTLDGSNDRQTLGAVEEDEGAIGVPRKQTEQDATGNNITKQEMAVDLPENLQTVAHPSHIVMPPPPLPPLTTQFGDADEILGNAPDSPSLRPVPSEQLPIISPLLNRGLAGTDYMGVILDSSLRSRGRGIITGAVSPVVDPGETHQGVSVIAQETLAPTIGDTTADEPLDGLSTAPEVFIVPAEEEGITAVTTTPGPSIVQQIADQRRGSLSEDDRQPSDYESEKDSLFDEFSDNEMRKRVAKSRNLGRSPLKSAGAFTPRRSIPYTKPSRLILETTSAEESSPSQPKTPFLYLPTPSPKVEKRDMHFPTSAPPKFMVGPYNSALGKEGTSPVRRKPNFWGATKGPVPNEISAYFGRPERGSDITPTTEMSQIEKEDNDAGASNTEEEISSFSTPGANEAEDNDDDDDDNEDDEEEEEQGLGFGSVFKSGVTTNVSCRIESFNVTELISIW